MIRARVPAAAATVLTLLLLQAALIGPAVGDWAISLPAVAVAAVAFVDGPATGMTFGFVLGLIADLASTHPAGVFALCWLALGLACGRQGGRHPLRHDAVLGGLMAAGSSCVAAVLLLVVHGRGTFAQIVVGAVPTAIGDVLLAFVVVAVVRRALATDRLRRPAPVYTELAVGRG